MKRKGTTKLHEEGGKKTDLYAPWLAQVTHRLKNPIQDPIFLQLTAVKDKNQSRARARRMKDKIMGPYKGPELVVL